MATIIDCGNDRYIAGDPADRLGIGEHWCDWCNGSGLEYGWDDELVICMGCDGGGVTECTDTACPTHSTLHPYPTSSAPSHARHPQIAGTECGRVNTGGRSPVRHSFLGLDT